MNKLLFNNKTENGGLNAQGRLTATEFNALVDAVNSHSDVFNDPSKSFAAPILLSDLDSVSLGLAPAIHLILDDSEEQPCAILFHLVRNNRQRAQVLLGNVEIGSDSVSLVSGDSPIILSRYISDGKLHPWSQIDLIDTFYDIFEEIRDLQLDYSVDFRENQKQHSQFSDLIEKIERRLATVVTEYVEPTVVTWRLGFKPNSMEDGTVTGPGVDTQWLRCYQMITPKQVRTAKLASGDLKLSTFDVAATSLPVKDAVISLMASLHDKPISLSFDCAQVKTDHVLMDVVLNDGVTNPCVLKGFRPARINENATDADKQLHVDIHIPVDLLAADTTVHSVDIYLYTDDGSVREVGFANIVYTIGDRRNLADEIIDLKTSKAEREELAGKAEREELSNVLAREPGAEVEDVYRPEMKVFDDEWTAADGTVIVSGVTYGCNGVDDLTYDEAIEIKQLYSKRKGWDYSRMFFASTVRALLPIWVPNATPISMRNMFQSSRSISKIVFLSNVSPCVVTISELFSAFHTCEKLREIDAILDVSQASNVGAIANFQECKNLEEIRIRRLNTNINFSSSPKLSLASLQYIVDNAANTGSVTVTVHPDVYAKLTDEADAEWHVLTAIASEMNITFATI